MGFLLGCLGKLLTPGIKVHRRINIIGLFAKHFRGKKKRAKKTKAGTLCLCIYLKVDNCYSILPEPDVPAWDWKLSPKSA